MLACSAKLTQLKHAQLPHYRHQVRTMQSAVTQSRACMALSMQALAGSTSSLPGYAALAETSAQGQHAHLAPDDAKEGALLQRLCLVNIRQPLAQVELGLALAVHALDLDQRRVVGLVALPSARARRQ